MHNAELWKLFTECEKQIFISSMDKCRSGGGAEMQAFLPHSAFYTQHSAFQKQIILLFVSEKAFDLAELVLSGAFSLFAFIISAAEKLFNAADLIFL